MLASQILTCAAAGLFALVMLLALVTTPVFPIARETRAEIAQFLKHFASPITLIGHTATIAAASLGALGL